jgi:hypothetical protein
MNSYRDNFDRLGERIGQENGDDLSVMDCVLMFVCVVMTVFVLYAMTAMAFGVDV